LEIEYCKASSKSTALKALHKSGLKIVERCEFAETTWRQLLEFNDDYMRDLELPVQQVEHRLIVGFNQTLNSKHFLRNGLKRELAT
jgi:hypothetical protein